VDDADVLHLLKVMLKANGRRGVPQGGVISPLLSTSLLAASNFLQRYRSAPISYAHPSSRRCNCRAHWAKAWVPRVDLADVLPARCTSPSAG